MTNQIHHYPEKEGHYIIKRLSADEDPVEYYTDDYFTFETKWIFDSMFGSRITEIVENVSGLDYELVKEKIENYKLKKIEN